MQTPVLRRGSIVGQRAEGIDCPSIRTPIDSIKSKKDGLITKPIVLGREFESKSSRTIYRIIVFILSIKNSSRRKDLGNVMSLMFEIAE